MSSLIPVGIDLGTTYSAAARVNEQGSTQLIANSDGEFLTPSAIYFDDVAVKVGRSAWEAAALEPDHCAEYIKRDVGREVYRNPIRGNLYPPEVLQSCILRELRNDITAAIGDTFGAVITVPAYFDEPRRKITADAGTMSGLEILDLVNEPTAAALAFGEKLGYLDPHGGANDRLTLLVFDLGGGTFDVTVIRIAPGEVRTLSTDGDVELGGVNWDERLAAHAEAQFRRQWPSVGEFTAGERVRLRRAAEQTKIQLSKRPLVTLQFSAQGKQFSHPVTINEFDELTQDLVERTCFTTRQALKAAGLLWKDIDRLLLVGGSTRLPAVRRAVAHLSGIEPDDQVHPDEAVARGAAIFAHHLIAQSGRAERSLKLAITDVNAHGLGIEGVNQLTLRRENVILIPRNTPLPHEVHRSFVTNVDNQRTVKVQLLEGESSIPEQCTDLASAGIRNVPPGLPAGTKIDVWYSFQANGRLAVRASIPNIGNQAQIELERVRGLADENVARWKKVLARDGGYSDLEEALQICVPNLEKERSFAYEPLPSSSETSNYRPRLEAAVPFGAPQAAADRLKAAFSKQNSADSSTMHASNSPEINGGISVRTFRLRRRVQELPTWIRVLGHILAPVIGLAIGYYVLCLIRPEANLLDWPLPRFGR
jgi:molecular chaperone DnaK